MPRTETPFRVRSCPLATVIPAFAVNRPVMVSPAFNTILSNPPAPVRTCRSFANAIAATFCQSSASGFPPLSGNSIVVMGAVPTASAAVMFTRPTGHRGSYSWGKTGKGSTVEMS